MVGRWIYDTVFPVNTGHFKGDIRVAYELLEPLDGGEPLRTVRAWVRLDIWKRSGSQDLRDEIPHVNIASKLEDLLCANLQGIEDPPDSGRIFSLYLTDYEKPTFEERDGDAPWKANLIVRPARLTEVEQAMRGVHPRNRTNVP